MRTKTPHRWARAGALAALALLATACGDDGDDTKTVTAVDYSFKDLPKSVKAGTTLVLENDSTKELHELVVIKIPDTETRSVDQLIKLPEAESDAIFGESMPAMVLLRAPGDGELIKAVGDGTLAEKGRYAVLCGIPTGADPAAYLAAAQAASDGPPQVPGGPPHFTQGMYGEIKVT